MTKGETEADVLLMQEQIHVLRERLRTVERGLHNAEDALRNSARRVDTYAGAIAAHDEAVAELRKVQSDILNWMRQSSDTTGETR